MNQLAPRKRELAVHKTIHPVVDALSYCARLGNGRPGFPPGWSPPTCV